MISDIASLLYNSLDSAFVWAREIYRAYGLSIVGIFFAIVTVTALGRYILRPFIGVGASDPALARRVKNKIAGKSNKE